jgi:hypothetical protein
VVAARLASVLHHARGRLAWLVLAAVAIVGGDAAMAATLEAREQALDGPNGNSEFGGDGVGVSALLPALKKAGCEWVQQGRAA